ARGRGCSRERRPLAVEVDEILRGWLAPAVGGAQQFLWCTAVENVPQLPRDVETILDGHVHSLSSLSGVGVAGVASEEYTRGVVDIVESINQAVAHFVDRVPGDFFHVDGVRRVDFIRL